jgi:hypothetical protein
MVVNELKCPYEISHSKQIFNIHANKIEPNYDINMTHFRPFKSS